MYDDDDDDEVDESNDDDNGEVDVSNDDNDVEVDVRNSHLQSWATGSVAHATALLQLPKTATGSRFREL